LKILSTKEKLTKIFYPSERIKYWWQGCFFLFLFIHFKTMKLNPLGHFILGMIFMITSVPNESYSIHASCALNLISTFSYDRIKDLHKWNKKTHSVGTGHKHQFIKWLKMLTIVSWSLVLYVVFCRSLFVLLCFLFWSLYCLLFFNTRIQITPMVSSNSS
jgi:hypothetical protein